MITPPYLKHGDSVGIVATARKITKKELEPALQILTSWGLKAILGATIGAEDHQFAGSDELRRQDFQFMMDHPDIKAIWCARGGYGTVRMVDGLDFSAFIENPKWVIGYSDITVLHSHIHNLGMETLHAQMPLEIENKTQETAGSLQKVLFGNQYAIECPSNSKLNRKGVAQGRLVGGNLSVLYSIVVSPSDINMKGKILFIEDLDEMLYHIDRMMQNLKRSGVLKNLGGLIVGGMSDMRDNTIPFGKNY